MNVSPWVSPSSLVRMRNQRPMLDALLDALDGDEVPGLDLEEAEDTAILEVVARDLPGRVLWDGTTLGMEFLGGDNDDVDFMLWDRTWLFLSYLDWVVLHRPIPTADHTSS